MSNSVWSKRYEIVAEKRSAGASGTTISALRREKEQRRVARRHEASAAYWTPERRAEQWAYAKAHGAAADAYNAVMVASDYRDSESATEAHRNVYSATLKALLASPEFDAKVEQKRVALAA
jgi:hypothetical protein